MLLPSQIAIADLLIDTENPRFVDLNQGQRVAIRSMAADQGKKLISLAKDIIEHGLNPSEFLLAIPSDNESSRYVVLEGNRRLTTLKILENPELINGAVTSSLLKQFRNLSSQYLETPILNVLCSVVDNRQAANHWIEIRHTGENEGSGIVRWGGEETARFRQRSGQAEPHLQILDFLENRGYLTEEARKAVPITNLKRLLSTPYVRTKLGLDLEREKGLVTRFPDEEIAKGLKRVIEDLAYGDVKVKDIYTKDDRIRYIDGLLADELPNISDPDAQFRPLDSEDAKSENSSSIDGATDTNKTKSAPSHKSRKKLIPRECVLHIQERRINEIYRELKKLDVYEFPNAAGPLLRIFVELTIDSYITKNNVTIDERAKLRDKITKVADELKQQSKLSGQELKPVRAAAQSNTYLASSVTTMNEYVHNYHFSPVPLDLVTAWDNLQRFIVAIWNDL